MLYKNEELLNLKDTSNKEVELVLNRMKEIKKEYKFPLKFVFNYCRRHDGNGIIGGLCVSVPLTVTVTDENGFHSVWTYQDKPPKYDKSTGNFEFEPCLLINGDIVLYEKDIEYVYFLLDICPLIKTGFLKVQDTAKEAKSKNTEIAGKSALGFYTSTLSPLTDENIRVLAIANGVNVDGLDEEETKFALRKAVEDRAHHKGVKEYERFIEDTKMGEKTYIKYNIQKAKEEGRVNWIDPKEGIGGKWEIYDTANALVDTVNIQPKDIQQRFDILTDYIFKNKELQDIIAGDEEVKDYSEYTSDDCIGKNYPFVSNVAKAKGLELFPNGRKAGVKLLVEMIKELESKQ